MLEDTLCKIPVYAFLMKQNKLLTTTVQRQYGLELHSILNTHTQHTNTVKQAV